MIEKSVDLEKKIKFLIVALSISGAFNVALLINFSFLAFKQNTTAIQEFTTTNQTVVVKEITTTLKDLLDQPMDRLVVLLNDGTSLEEGYKIRDLALAILVNYHYLNIEKALPGLDVQKRVAIFEKKDTGEQFEIILFPGLSKDHFVAISKFVNSEKWPYTSEGLFFELKKNGLGCERSLKDTFYKTTQFELIEILFKRSEIKASSEVVLKLLLDADFSILDQQVTKLKHKGELTKDILVEFLKEYLRFNSTSAANLLIEADANHVLKNFEDGELKKLIKLLKNKNQVTLKFLQGVMSSLRSDDIRKEAAKNPPLEISSSKIKKYTIKEGDTLWGIAKVHKVSVQKILELNQIEKNKPLQIGKSLNIPMDN